jgi:hypothetical protein
VKRYVLIGTSVVFLFFSPIIFQAHSTEKEKSFSLKQDRWEKDRYNIIDSKTGKPSGGYIKKDRWEPDKRWNIYDKNNQEKGVIEKDRWEPDKKWNIIIND